MLGITERLERHQVALYLAAIAIGVASGLASPQSRLLEHAIEPVLVLLLFATFLAVPFARIGAALRDGRFLAGLMAVNFIVVPAIVFGLSRFVATDDALLFGVLLVLLTPCVDYVIVFTGLAGGARDRLLAAAPLLMLAQMLLLPVYLLLFIGPSSAQLIDIGPFVRAFVVLIVVPLGAAMIVQRLSRRVELARGLGGVAQALMVPLMMATLAVVVASQIGAVGAQAGAVITVVPIYAAFAAIMIGVGMLVSRAVRLDASAARALTFSGVTRNSLVVLPLALALPDALSLVPLVVVTQTLVELLVMVWMVRLVPALIPAERAPA